MTASADPAATEAANLARDQDVLHEIAQRVLWLSAAIVDAANAGRANHSGVKVGGHQASSASMVDIMTALWFAELTPLDRVSVKPHASPVLHAVNYLLGDLDESYLPTLRAQGGLQSYPSRLKDPDTVDFSTGSVGIGAAARGGGGGAPAPLHRLPVSRLSALRPLHQPARRCRARRGRHLGGGRRPCGGPAGGTAVGGGP